MNESREVRCPASFFVGLGFAVAAAVMGAALYGGGSWALGALAGAGAVAVDFYFLAIFAATWVKAARRGGRGLLALGVVALVGKTFLPPAIVLILVWANAVSAYPAAFGALAAATCAPFLLAFGFLRESVPKPSRSWKS